MLKWKVSAGKLLKACTITFELEHRVLIRPLSKYSGDKDVNGVYVGLVGQGFNKRHLIYIDTNLPMERANKTLWHELTHAYQREHSEWKKDFTLIDGAKYSIDYKRDFDGYWNCHPEQHARLMADAMSEKVMLCYKNKK